MFQYFECYSFSESQVNLTEEKDPYKDYRFAKWMTKNVGVQGIPPSAFYTEPNKKLAENLIRLCFIKVSYSTEIIYSH